MNDLELESMPVYGLNSQKKQCLMLDHMNELVNWHYSSCREYQNILDAANYEMGHVPATVSDLPFLPVRLFKDYDLKSIPAESVFKTLNSSGTTSQKVSRIALDRETSKYQTKALVYILQNFLGKQRLPMLIIDHPNVIKDRASFSARGAGILGVSNFGRDHTYALNEAMEIDFELVDAFLRDHEGEEIFVFGFTFMIWQYLFKPLLASGRRIDLGNSVMIHSGGWKSCRKKPSTTTPSRLPSKSRPT